jgi:hypothetical protein
MTKYVSIFLSALLAFASIPSFGQKLKPGFDKEEYIELLRLFSKQIDTAYTKGITPPQHYKRVYRSPVVGMDNRWDLFMRDDSVAVISIRGTTNTSVSWLENFYSAMVPAAGQIKLSDEYTFNYHLADHPQAAVHVGWLIATGSLAPDIVQKVDSCYKEGIRDFYVVGHSQGGAISYMMTSHLNHLKKEGTLPQGIQFKTYCSAAPKPGNLHYAYEYERLTQMGWGYNVVNAADWVPETPFSIQTVNDFNAVNPFTDAKSIIKKQKFPQKVALNYVYNDLNKPAVKAQRKYQRYMGKMASTYVKKHLNGYQAPQYYDSNNYVRTGNYIVLTPDEEYYKIYPDNKDKVFVHHMLQPYLHLAKQLP